MKKVLTVFFNGTSHPTTGEKAQIHLANALYSTGISADDQEFKNYDGVGIARPFMGSIFGTGIDEQCNEVVEQVLQTIQEGDELTLNIYGHSRGGISALMVAKQLSKLDPARLSINLALHDPVPGNMLITPVLDCWDISLANKVMDLSECKPLKKVLALYPNQEVTFHAPVFPNYPQDTVVQEVIVPGCHALAQFVEIEYLGLIRALNQQSLIASSKVLSFLSENGSSFEQCGISHPYSHNDFFTEMDNKWKNLKNDQNLYRYGHSKDGRCIVTKPTGNFFGQDKSNPDDASRTAFETRWLFSQTNFKVWMMRAVLAAAFSAILVLNAHLAIPVAVAIACGLAYLLTSPLANWAAQRYFYPHFAIRELPESQETQAQEISLKLN